MVEVGQFFYAFPSQKGAKNQSLCREYTLPRDEKENCAEGWIESDARFGPVSDIKVCKTHERYRVEVKVPSLFEDQTTSWIRIVNAVEKYVREAMPIQEEERASVKPAAKARPILKPSSTSNWNFIPMEQRNWIDIEVKRSKDPYCFREMQGGSIRGFTILVRRNKRNFKHGSGDVDRRSVKRWWTEEKVSIMFETKLSRKTLVLSSHSRSLGKPYSGNARVNPALQDNVLLPKDFTKYVYHVGNGKELRSMVRNALVPGGFSTKTGRYAVFFTVVNPMDDEQGLREIFCDLSKQESRLTRFLGNHFKSRFFGAIYCSLKCQHMTHNPPHLILICVPATDHDLDCCVWLKD